MAKKVISLKLGKKPIEIRANASGYQIAFLRTNSKTGEIEDGEKWYFSSFANCVQELYEVSCRIKLVSKNIKTMHDIGAAMLDEKERIRKIIEPFELLSKKL